MTVPTPPTGCMNKKPHRSHLIYNRVDGRPTGTECAGVPSTPTDRLNETRARLAATLAELATPEQRKEAADELAEADFNVFRAAVPAPPNQQGETVNDTPPPETDAFPLRCFDGFRMTTYAERQARDEMRQRLNHPEAFR